MLPKSDVVELDMRFDDGLKMVISASVVVPPWSNEDHSARSLTPPSV